MLTSNLICSYGNGSIEKFGIVSQSQGFQTLCWYCGIYQSEFLETYATGHIYYISSSLYEAIHDHLC